MSKWTQVIQSKTFWTVVVMFGTYTINAYGHFLSPELITLITGLLSAVAVYFKINSSTVYTPSGVTPPASGTSVTVVQP